MSESRKSSLVGIFAVDPGSATGIDVGLWRLNCSVSEAVRDLVGYNRELKGDLLSQAAEIALCWREAIEHWTFEDGLRVDDCWMVIEHYQQQPTHRRLADSSLDPVRLAGMIMGYRLGQSDLYERLGLGPTNVVRYVKQSPSAAMTYATDARLRNWGSWIKGSDHRRDARRHALAFRNSLNS